MLLLIEFLSYFCKYSQADTQKNSTLSYLYLKFLQQLWNNSRRYLFFFLVWVFFHEHSRFTGQQGKGEDISLTPLYHFHSLHRHLGISRAITAESSPLHIASSRTWTGNLWFPSASCEPLSYVPLNIQSY